jgi:hypothetical protein
MLVLLLGLRGRLGFGLLVQLQILKLMLVLHCVCMCV